MTDILALDQRHIWHPFTQERTAPPPVAIARGEGAWLVDVDGKRYLDLISSWWVNLHGHGRAEIADAIAAQARQLEHVIFAGFTHEPAARLAATLAEMLPGDLNRVFFSDNGSTAVEAALKMAWQYWRNRGERQRTRLLAFEGGYHGDTFGAMSMGRASGFFGAFEDLFFEVQHLPYPGTWPDDAEGEAKEQAALAALDAWLARHGAETAAIILEPLVQGASGMRMVRPAFLRAALERLRAAGVLIIFDEVMTGFGRTGDLFACQTLGITPDMICLSKGLTGGFLPLSVTVCRDGIYEAFLGDSFAQALAHGHSYTANPLGCAAALASMALTRADECTMQRACISAVHTRMLDEVRHLPQITAARQCGTIAAFDIVSDDAGYLSALGPQLKAQFLTEGLLVRPLGNTVYLMPPYCVGETALEDAWRRVIEIVA